MKYTVALLFLHLLLIKGIKILHYWEFAQLDVGTDRRIHSPELACLFLDKANTQNARYSLECQCFGKIFGVDLQHMVTFSLECQYSIRSKPHFPIHSGCEMKTQEGELGVWHLRQNETFLLSNFLEIAYILKYSQFWIFHFVIYFML